VSPMATYIDSSSLHLSPSISTQNAEQVILKFDAGDSLKCFCVSRDAVHRLRLGVLYVIQLKYHTVSRTCVYTRKKRIASPALIFTKISKC
jgi:hypothetical protein